MELVSTNKLESQAGSRLADSTATHARQVLSEELGKERYPDLPSWGLVVGITSSAQKPQCS